VSTKRVVIEAEESLEGVLVEGAGKGGVVICHPHPLYGGSMWNNVVDAMEDGFLRSGFTTLKFNFRGVGASTGRYDEGEGEIRDVVAASRFTREGVGKGERFVLAGYSFGAWVCARAASEVGGGLELFLVAYPFSFYGTEELRAFPGKVCLVGGSLDDVAPLDSLLSVYRDLKTEKSLKVVPSSHFFAGHEGEITDFIRENFEEKG
jgi:alpha/beta superfamily hydrolase